MHPIDQTGPLVLAVFIFQLIPGPGTLNILRSTGQYGLKAGFASVSGTLIGGLFCMLGAASGLEAIFRDQPAALRMLQTAGSLYLAWMGWRLLTRQSGSAAARSAAYGVPGWGWHLRQALAISLTNPKVILFYFALMPLFFRAPVTAESLGTTVLCVTGTSFLYQSGLVLAGHAAARRLGSLPAVRLLVQRVAGATLLGFAVRLLLA